MGLRAFIALPLEEGGTVLRPLAERNKDADVSTLTTEFAYGLARNHTLFFALPYRLSPSGSDRTGDLGALYRYTAWVEDEREGTRRLGLLGGVVLPSDGNRDARVQLGAVATFFRGRHEWDADFLWVDGRGISPATARYDLSWQYRLTPVKRPEWGLGSEWNSVIELGGRWTEGVRTTHQLTLGLQFIAGRWVAEGGVVRDLNAPHQTQFLLGLRFHF